MARTKNTCRRGTSNAFATKAARELFNKQGLFNKQHGTAKKRRVPTNYYNVSGHQSSLSGGGGCLGHALRSYYVSFFMKQ
jgi:hypothetical protein